MSASLVGSEMCIRDSCLQRRTRALASKRSFVRAWVHASVKVVPSTQRAVSYTHLTLPTICSV
eukprot:7531596-Alexandrium_andersonii.AAC.1